MSLPLALAAVIWLAAIALALLAWHVGGSEAQLHWTTSHAAITFTPSRFLSSGRTLACW